ncbi:MAG: prepilin-type N-terminal cleavage/methylation domain-containing protein [Veillonellaceae bacterium]|nr:prepilin-type N-terminal cleavage/methylation domain-containing protein [Veillonellaceae bacterium]
MKKFLKNRKAKGFTLVELLIVLIIIGILAGALLLVAGAGTDKAQATKIVSDLRSMKAAALMCYADNNKWPTAIESLEPYMEKNLKKEQFKVYTDTTKGNWVGFISKDVVTKGVGDRLTLMVNPGNVPIYDGNENVPNSTDQTFGSTSCVWMRVD